MIGEDGEHTRDTMPRQVEVALWLSGAQSVVGVIQAALTMGWIHFQDAQVKVGFYTIIGAAWLYGLYRRNNWLRWITVIYTGLSLVAMPLTVAKLHDATQVTTHLVAALLGIPVAVLLCLPKARLWYRHGAVS
jgi:hypothetical protein